MYPGVRMKLTGWAIALAAALATPAMAQSTTAATNEAASATAATNEAAAAAAGNAMTADPAGTGGPAQDASQAEPFSYSTPNPGVGEPVPGAWSTQEQVTEVGQQAANFHNYWLLALCAVISIVVLGLLAFAMVRFRRGANPNPSRTSHNTAIEVIWTVIPVLILVAIAIPSIRLMRAQYSFPKPDLTVKVIGNQWYWTYQYPDNGGFELVSNLLKEQADVKAGDRFRTDADGPPLLAVDERLVIPAGKVVKFLVTSNDVIHSFAVPSFWTKIDANPGQINETWVKVDKPGVYFGQCSELCGARHGYMPIAVEVVPADKFAAWVGSKGGTMPGATPAAAPAGAQPAAVPAAATPAAAQPNPPTPSVANRATAND